MEEKKYLSNLKLSNVSPNFNTSEMDALSLDTLIKSPNLISLGRENVAETSYHGDKVESLGALRKEFIDPEVGFVRNMSF